MAGPEDAATILEQFIHDAANLPAEVCHMMEEIQAKDRDLQRHQSAINAKDSSLQKHLKLNGSLNAHPKEREFSDSILKNYDQCLELQSDKIKLSDKACTLLDRQLKSLDVKIRELQNDGQLSDGPPIPSIFNRKIDYPDLGRGFFMQQRQQPHQPLQTTSGNAPAGALNSNLTTHRMNSQNHLSPSAAQQVSSRLSQLSAGPNHLNRNSAPATPASSAQQLQQQVSTQRQRESSAGATEHKKRRLNLSNLPAQSSTLRQSSLGPGTPKVGTPTGNVNRAGSAGPRSASIPSAQGPKKSAGLPKKLTPHHQQIAKLKGKPGKPGKRPSGPKRKGMSPSVRSRNATGDEEDSIASSADDTDASTTTRSRRGGTAGARASSAAAAKAVNASGTGAGAAGPAAASGNESESARSKKHKHKHKPKPKSKDEDVEMGEDASSGSDEGDDDEGEPDDDRKYCFCQRISFGEMVCCENEKCPNEWFHLECVGLKAAPKDSDVWYCPECRPKFTGGVRK